MFVTRKFPPPISILLVILLSIAIDSAIAQYDEEDEYLPPPEDVFVYQIDSDKKEAKLMNETVKPDAEIQSVFLGQSTWLKSPK